MGRVACGVDKAAWGIGPPEVSGHVGRKPRWFARCAVLDRRAAVVPGLWMP
ncbi:hypothetical protein GCM10029964_127700 [Kibdelosporangium lantanae]